MSKSLYEMLASGLDGRLPMHMPGHKRNARLSPYLSGLHAELDITEIEGFDNLHAPGGILLEGMQRAAALWGATRSFYLVNGSTGGILAGMRALSKPGDTVIMQRDCHMSVYQGVGLLHLRPVYLYPEMVEGYGIAASLKPQRLMRCLDEHPEARLLVLGCPSYEGVLSDLQELVRLAHARGVKVLIDAAHGAHLGISPWFGEGAVQSGADIVVHSLHKTLPSLTQSALAHAGNEQAARLLQEQLDVFQTSSPSYLLMASIDGCIRLLEQQGEELLLRWHQNMEAFYHQAAQLEHLDVLGAKGLPEGVYARDISKVLIGCSRSGLSGYRLMQRLHEGYGIDLEMASPSSALAMTGMGDSEETLSRLLSALFELDGQAKPKELPPSPALPQARPLCTPAEALGMECEYISPAQAAGRVSAEYVMIYPPGIPLLVPGEVIDAGVLEALSKADSTVHTKSKYEQGLVAVMKGMSEM